MKYAAYGALALCVLFAGLYWSRSEPRNAPPFDVVVISIDSLRADHMGVYGYSRETTPHIDSFARSATVFDSYFATSFLTPISEASVHTGTYPFRNGVVNFQTAMSPKVLTLAQILQGRGYKTAAFGSSLEFAYYPAMRSTFSRGFDTYEINSDLTTPWFGRDMLHADDAIEWMRSQRAAGKRFYLWLTVGSAHWPYGKNEPHYFSDSSYAGPLKDTEPFEDNSVAALFGKKYGRVYEGKLYGDSKSVVKNDASRDIRYVRDRYDDGLVKTDGDLKGILELLQGGDFASSTIVVIQSEHGEDFGEHGYIAHYDVLDTQTHVPLILRIPDIQPRRVSSLASGVDVLPTLLESLSVPAPDNIDGVSLLGSMSGSATGTRDAVFLTRTPLWERVISTISPFFDSIVASDDQSPIFDTAIRTEKWKLVHRMSREALRSNSWWTYLTGKTMEIPEYQLFDLKNDPGELRSVYARLSTDPDIIALRERLTAWEEKMGKRQKNGLPLEKIQPYF